MYLGHGPNRYICTVIDEIKAILKPFNNIPRFNPCRLLSKDREIYIGSLLEEIRSMAQRMESSLDDVNDVREYTKYRSDLLKECRKLKEEKDKLMDELGKEKKDDN